MNENNNCLIDFNCSADGCKAKIDFSIQDIESNGPLTCGNCGKSYSFHHEFVDKIRRFSRLIEAVQEARDILGDANVAIDVKDRQVKVPYRLLLTRMNSLVTLKMEDGEINFRFRVEPLNDSEVIK